MRGHRPRVCVCVCIISWPLGPVFDYRALSDLVCSGIAVSSSAESAKSVVRQFMHFAENIHKPDKSNAQCPQWMVCCWTGKIVADCHKQCKIIIMLRVSYAICTSLSLSLSCCPSKGKRMEKGCSGASAGSPAVLDDANHRDCCVSMERPRAANVATSLLATAAPASCALFARR